MKIGKGAATGDFCLGDAKLSEHPVAGCNDGDDKAPGQKRRRPEGFRAQAGLALLVSGRRPAGGMYAPSSRPADRLGHENSTLPNYPKGPKDSDSGLSQECPCTQTRHDVG